MRDNGDMTVNYEYDCWC